MHVYLGELNSTDWNQQNNARRVAFYYDDFFQSQHGGYYVLYIGELPIDPLSR